MSVRVGGNMSTYRNRLAALAAFALMLGAIHAAAAQEKIKIGIIGPFSGPYASVGVNFHQAIDAFVALHGRQAGGREIELVYRDVAGANPAEAKRLAEELIVREKVAVLGGLYLTPEAAAVAPVVTETKTPTVIFVPGTAPIIRQSPYFVRASDTLWQPATIAAEWAMKNGKKRAYVAVADFAAGYDVQEAFTTRFKALGGEILGADHIPLSTVDFAPVAERIANAKPDLAYVFVPNGAPSVGLMRALATRGLIGGATTVMGMDETDDGDMKLFDNSIIGVYSAHLYAVGLPNEENRRFKEALKAKFGPDLVPGALTAVSYSGMQMIYHLVETQKGKPFDGAAAIEAMRGYVWESPRGPLKVEADTRDITPNIYVRRVEKVNGHLENVVVETFAAVKDPWAASHPAK